MGREKFHFISLNLLKKRHCDVIEWIKKSAEDKEMSISSFCINVLKKEYESQKENNNGKRENRNNI